MVGRQREGKSERPGEYFANVTYKAIKDEGQPQRLTLQSKI